MHISVHAATPFGVLYYTVRFVFSVRLDVSAGGGHAGGGKHRFFLFIFPFLFCPTSLAVRDPFPRQRWWSRGLCVPALTRLFAFHCKFVKCSPASGFELTISLLAAFQVTTGATILRPT